MIQGSEPGGVPSCGHNIAPPVCLQRCRLQSGRRWRRRARRRAEPPSAPEFLSAPTASSPAAAPSAHSSAGGPGGAPSASSAARRAPAEPAGHPNIHESAGRAERRSNLRCEQLTFPKACRSSSFSTIRSLSSFSTSFISARHVCRTHRIDNTLIIHVNVLVMLHSDV